MSKVNNFSLAVLKKGDIESIKDENIKNEILAIQKNMDLSNAGIMNFASEASASLRDFSTSILESVKVKDLPDVDDMLTNLMTEINKVDANTLMQKKTNFFAKLFKTDDIKAFKMKYDNVAAAMVGIKGSLTDAQLQLQKDVATCDKYIEQDLTYIQELDKYILAGTLKKEELIQEVALKQQTLDNEDMLAVQEVNRMNNTIDRLDRKLTNLYLLRDIAIQNIPQISLIQQGDMVLIEKIQSSIDSAIPLWESQIVIAITLAKQKNGIEMQRAITDTINSMIKNNSELIKTNAIEIAKQLNEGIIDVNVLMNSSQNLIATLEGVRQESINGAKKREETIRLLTENQEKLSTALLQQTTVAIECLEQK